MKRMFTGLQRRVTSSPSSAQGSPSPTPSGNDSPETIIAREIKAFCESGGPNSGSNDYLHLPAIVEAAESSAHAAREAAVRIRKYLSSPSKAQRGVQYNSIMLIRILSENPGHTFTRNFDAKFVNTVKELLREGRDMGAQQMLRETLEMFETQKSWDEDLAGLIAMWKKEKGRMGSYSRPPAPPGQAPPLQQQFPQATPSRRGDQLPPPDELASRISEAKTSANLLIQLAQSTPAAEVQSHELMREFSVRCQSASRSVQAYMAVENPPPDENTMLTLIETNEQLSVALSKYQRTLLNARKALGTSTPLTSPDSNAANRGAVHSPPPGPPPSSLAAANGQTNGNHNLESGILIPELGDLGSSPFNTKDTNDSRSPPTHASLNEPSTLFRFDTPIEVAADVPATTQQPAAAKRYEYNADEFAVENPFADHTAQDDHDSDHDRHHVPSRKAV